MAYDMDCIDRELDLSNEETTDNNGAMYVCMYNKRREQRSYVIHVVVIHIALY